ncbi:MAG: hypothetical protein Q8N94_01140 [Methanoregula sp.]|nr:hypothetical protein [Methanoregula sp.]
MDKIIRITLGLIIVLLVTFVASVSYTGFVEQTYRTSLSSTYDYSCTITTDSQLSNVTLFIPVPADLTGNSPIVAQYSAQEIEGRPADWKVALYDTGKATLAKITTPAIIPPSGTSPSHPFTIRLSINMGSKDIINTRSPIEQGVMFRPVQDAQKVNCPAKNTGVSGDPICYQYLIPVYADYQAPMNASVSITSTLQGKNSWKIFDPQFNEYQAEISVLMFGENHGWTVMKGMLESNMGTNNVPASPS